MSITYNNIKYKLDTIITPVKKSLKFSNSISKLGVKLNTAPPTLDLRQWILPIRDQGQNGDCVAFAASVIVEYCAKRSHSYTGYLSPWFIYVLGGAVCCTSGMNPTGAFNVLMNYGCAPEASYHTPNQCALVTSKDITDCVYTNAKNFRISSYASINSVDEMKQALINYGPCMVCVKVYNTSPQMWVPPNGIPTSCAGGHAMAVVGYDSNSFIIRNSWGTSWGNGGYSNLYFKDYQYVIQAWSAISINPLPPFDGLLIDIPSIVFLTIIGLFIVYLFYYIYSKRLYKLSLYNFSFSYGRSLSEILFGIMLIITIITMVNMNGLNNICIVNLTVISLYLLSLLNN